MKKKIVSLFVCMVLVLSVAMPFCFATDGGFAGSGFGGGGIDSWGSNDYNLGYAGSVIGADSFVKYNETHPVTGTDWQGLGALGLSAMTGDWNIAKDYFNGSGSASSGVGSSSGRPYNSTVYNGNTTNNTTNNTSLVTNNNNTSYFNTINNNQWITNQISNVYYNNEYNTYNIQTTNIENNYYVTYSPTYVTVLNYVPEQDIYDISCYYYQLPDGRNSFDLKAEDVWGTVFTYKAVNYDYVPEDDGKTLALYHFDGDFKDSSCHALLGNTLDAIKFVESSFTGAYYTSKTKNLFSTVNLPTSKDYNLTSQPWTIEFTTNMSNSDGGNYFSYKNFSVFLSSSCPTYYCKSDAPDSSYNSSVHWCVAFDGSNISFFKNGIKQTFTYLYTYTGVGLTDYTYSSVSMQSVPISGSLVVNPQSGATFNLGVIDFQVTSGNLTLRLYGTQYIDELRVSKGVLYAESYTPRSQPFDTNNVFVLPKTGNENDLAVASLIPVSEYRFGGVRPTYPSQGSVYINLESNKIKSVQQFQTDGWYGIDASVYSGGKWVTAKDYDVSDSSIVKPPDSGGGGSSSVPDGGGSGGSGGSGDSLWTKFFDAVAGFIKKLVAFLASILTIAFDGLTTIFGKLFGLFEKLLTFPAQFTDFLSAAVPFVPAELWSIVLLGLTLSIVLMFIKFFRG